MLVLMARKRRIDFPGAWHHVMNRGARRESIFRDEEDCLLFLLCLSETVERFSLEVHAYALMPNHYHLLIRSVKGNLSRCMQKLGSDFTQRLNARHKWDGPVFRGRFRNQRVNESTHLKTLVPYIHLNAVRANLATSPEAVLWSSYQAYIGQLRRPTYLTCEVILSLYGGVDNLIAHVRGLREGSIPWPSGFELKRGIFKGWEGEPIGFENKRRARETNVAEVQAIITDIVDDNWERVCARRKGPGGNSMLRFAVWALREGTDLTQLEIGALVDCSSAHVAVLLNRLRHQAKTPQMATWMYEFRTQANGTR